MIPLNQLIPECLLALGAAFMLGNLAAYIRLRPAWREARAARGGQAARRGAKGATRTDRAGASKASQAGASKTSRTGAAKTSRTSAAKATASRTGTATPGRAGSAEARRERATARGAKAAAAPRAGASSRVNARVREPTASGSKLPSRTRVLVNVLIGLVITVAALATLIRG